MRHPRGGAENPHVVAQGEEGRVVAQGGWSTGGRAHERTRREGEWMVVRHGSSRLTMAAAAARLDAHAASGRRGLKVRPAGAAAWLGTRGRKEGWGGRVLTACEESGYGGCNSGGQKYRRSASARVSAAAALVVVARRAARGKTCGGGERSRAVASSSHARASGEATALATAA